MPIWRGLVIFDNMANAFYAMRNANSYLLEVLLHDCLFKIEEEEMLRAELRKIEARKREREKKTADLQKLIAQADIASPVEVSSVQ